MLCVSVSFRVLVGNARNYHGINLLGRGIQLGGEKNAGNGG